MFVDLLDIFHLPDDHQCNHFIPFPDHEFLNLEIDYRTFRAWAVHSIVVFCDFIRSISDPRRKQYGNCGIHDQIFQAFDLRWRHFLAAQYFGRNDHILNGYDDSMHGFMANFNVRPRDPMLSIPWDAEKALLLANGYQVQMVPTCPHRPIHNILRPSIIALGRSWSRILVRIRIH